MAVTDLAELYRTNPVKALELALRRTRWGKLSNPDARMRRINELIGGHGVEAIHSHNWRNGYWCDVAALYVNMGDTYDSTIICQVTGNSRYEVRYSITCLGDFVERMGRKLELK